MVNIHLHAHLFRQFLRAWSSFAFSGFDLGILLSTLFIWASLTCFTLIFHYKKKEKFWFSDISTGYKYGTLLWNELNLKLLLELSILFSTSGKYFSTGYKFLIMLINVDLNFVIFWPNDIFSFGIVFFFIEKNHDDLQSILFSEANDESLMFLEDTSLFLVNPAARVCLLW